MNATLVRPMGKADERKRWLWELSLEEAFDLRTGTEPARVLEPEFYMLYWIKQATGKDYADILTDMIRKPLARLYEKHKKDIERHQKGEREKHRVIQESGEEE